MNQENPNREEFKISGKDLKEKIKKLLQEGNVTRIIIKNERGDSVVEIPVNFAVLGVVLAPTLAAVGAIAVFLTNCTLIVERRQSA